MLGAVAEAHEQDLVESLTTVAEAAVVMRGAEGSVTSAMKIWSQLEAPVPERTFCT